MNDVALLVILGGWLIAIGGLLICIARWPLDK